jgi:CRP-like cAMP-binding protein
MEGLHGPAAGQRVNPAVLRQLLPGYSAAELDQLLAASHEHDFAAGEWLCREGTTASSCFLVTSGAVEVVKLLDGHERVLATLRPGTFVGQMALIDSEPRSASVRALAPTQTLEIRRADFQRLLDARSPRALRFQEQIAVAGIRQLRAATDRLALVLCNSVRPTASQPTPTLDREALARIQAGTSEWEVVLDESARAGRKMS